MSYLYEFAQRLAFVSIIACVGEYILPEGAIKRSAERVFGLLVMLCMVEPLTRLFWESA